MYIYIHTQCFVDYLLIQHIHETSPIPLQKLHLPIDAAMIMDSAQLILRSQVSGVVHLRRSRLRHRWWDLPIFWWELLREHPWVCLTNIEGWKLKKGLMTQVETWTWSVCFACPSLEHLWEVANTYILCDILVWRIINMACVSVHSGD